MTTSITLKGIRSYKAGKDEQDTILEIPITPFDEQAEAAMVAVRDAFGLTDRDIDDLTDEVRRLQVMSIVRKALTR